MRWIDAAWPSQNATLPIESSLFCVASTPVPLLPRFFEWQATIPNSTKIEFFVQGRAKTTDAYAPTTPLLAGTATTSSPGTSWVRGPTTVDALLKTQGLSSQRYLLVTMTFTPDAAGTLAPTLTSWRQVYDCVFAE